MLDIGAPRQGGLWTECGTCKGVGRVTRAETVYVPDPVRRYVSQMQRVTRSVECPICQGTGREA